MKYFLGSCSSFGIVCLFFYICLADIDYQLPTTSCTISSAIGTSIYCCNGNCADGTSIGKPGLCASYTDECLDLATPPSCSPNQIFSYANENATDAGIGYCYLEECRWQKNTWSWNCCDCPSGYLAVAPGCGEGSRIDSGLCAACTGANEQLQFNSINQAYTCVTTSISSSTTTSKTTSITTSTTSSTTSSSATCAEFYRELDETVGGVGRVATTIGSFCPLSSKGLVDKVTYVATYLGDVYTGAKALINSGTHGDNAFDAALAIIATIDGFAVAALGVPAEGTFLATVFAGYEAACTFDAAVAAATALFDAALQIAISKTCGTAIFTRSARLARRPLAGRAAVQDAQNPCIQILDFFPFNFDAPAQLDNDCNKLYATSDTQNLTEPLRQACHSYQNSGNSTLMIDLGHVLKAVQSFVPYCKNLKTASSLVASVVSSSRSTTSSSRMSPFPSSERTTTSMKSISSKVSFSSYSKRLSSTSSQRPSQTSHTRTRSNT
jgi:hypothetical protein